MRKGILFVLSGPSGAGKGTVLRKVFKNIDGLQFSISATTRQPRTGEVDGKNYHFVSDECFDEMIRNNELLEHIEKYGNRYGTIKKNITQALNQGKDIILEIETCGAESVSNTDFEQVSIFLTPSSFKQLHKRLNERNTETKEKQNIRLDLGRQEMECAYNYDYIVINDDLEVAIKDIIAIITAERRRVNRNKQLINNIIQGEI